MSQQPQNTSNSTQPTKDQAAPEQSTSNGAAGAKDGAKKLPQLSALEDDDEFEVRIARWRRRPSLTCCLGVPGCRYACWRVFGRLVLMNVAENGPTTLAHLAAKTGVADPSDHLWEDNWDDDDVEDAFTLQLR